MSNLDDIRARLAALPDIDWAKVERDADENEYYDRYAHIGPIMVPISDPEEELPQHIEQARIDAAKDEAIIDFLAHAADDIRRLLARLDERGR